MSRRALTLIAAIAAIITPFAAADAGPRSRDDWRPEDRTKWEQIGGAEIGNRLESVEIEVGRREGRFKAIGFTVRGNDVRIEDIKVYYGGGVVETLSVRDVVRDGTRSAPIDLPGREQFIHRLVVSYRSMGPVRLEFYGEQFQWEELGCQTVGFLDPRDVIRVGKREGTFRAIKLKVSDAPLRLERLRVVFGDQTAQGFDVRSALPPGSESRPLDLRGDVRYIDRIELDYLPSISTRRGARVCVLGNQGGRYLTRDDDRGRDWDRDRYRDRR